MSNPFQSTDKQALDSYEQAIKHPGSLLEAQANHDQKAVDEWLRRAKAGEIVRIM